MGISVFDATIGDLKATLDHLNIPNPEQKDLLSIFESTRSQIVNLADPALQPAGWADLENRVRVAPEKAVAANCSAVREWDARIEEEHGPDAVWLAVSHGDIIKAILADAYGLHLDLFQRINVDPASISIVRYGPDRPHVLATNTHEGDLAWLAAPTQPGGVVGGGAGPAD